MSVPVCHRISLAIAGQAAAAARFRAQPGEALALERRLGECVAPGEAPDMARVRIVLDEHPATSAQAMVEALLASLPSGAVSLPEEVGRTQLCNVALKLDFCVAMECDDVARAPRLGEVLVRFRRTGVGAAPAGGPEVLRIAMTDPAADQDTDALVGLFTRVLGTVLVAHGHATDLSVTQAPVVELVGAVEDAVAWLARALDAAGLAELAGRVGAVRLEDEPGTALAA